MRTIALVCLIAIFFTAFYSLWMLSFSLYILIGLVWVKYDSNKSPTYTRMPYITTKGTIFLFSIWPLIVICDCYDRWQTIKKGERFVTHDGDCLRKFPDWNSAVECARKRAKESNEREMILDQTIFVKRMGLTQAKSWFVCPDGRVEKLHRYLVDPKWLSLLKFFTFPICVCFLVFFNPKKFIKKEENDNALQKAFSSVEEKKHHIYIVIRAFWHSLGLIIFFVILGALVGLFLRHKFNNPTQYMVSLLQVGGACLLLWGTLFIRGWEIQTWAGVTLTERVNQWIYRTLCCMGTSIIICSLVWAIK